MKKSLSFILALVFIISNLMCIVPLAEETGTGELEISSASLQFGANVYLMVAVDYSELYDGYEAAKQKVTVKITLKGGEEITLTPDDCVAQTEGFPATSVGFRLTTLSAKNMADVLTVQAYDDGNKSGEPITYSILEYAVKAKVEYADKELLCAAIDAMLEFGAEAQRAFAYEGDYPLYDSDGYVDYGMLIVYGGANKKLFGKVGTSVTPTASESVGTNPVLYDSAYEELLANTVTVKEGVSKCFFVGDNTITPYNLDLDWYKGETVTTYYNYTHLTKNSNASMNKEFNMFMDYATKSLTLDVSKTNSEYTTWNVSGGSNSKSLVTLTDTVITKYYDHGVREIGNGYLYINSNNILTYQDMLADVADGKIGERTGITGVTENLKPTSSGYNFNFQGARTSNMIGDDGKLTVTFTFKLATGTNGKELGFFNAFRFRTKTTTTILYLYDNTKAKEGVITLSNKGKEIVLSTEEWTTFHIVVDGKSDLLTLYNSDGEIVDTKTFANAMAYLTDTTDYAYLNWNIAGSQAGYINKILFTKGSIFE